MGALRIEGLSKGWADVVGVDDLTLEVDEGELVTMLGASGSGKTTLLRMIAGLEKPDAGRVLVDDQDVTDLPPARRGVGMVFQGFALFPHLDVAENIGFGLDARGIRGGERARRVREAAERVQVGDLLARRPDALSGGERQRVALARALAGSPRVLLLDEPLSALDARLRAAVRVEIRSLQSELGVTTLYVTHDQVEAMILGRRLAVMDAGRVVQYDAPAKVYERPETIDVAAFVGDPPMNLLPARVQGGRAVAGSLSVALPTGRQDGSEVVIGFRPESARVGAGDAAVLELVEAVGHDRIWRLRVGEQLIAVRPPSDLQAHEGEKLGIVVDEDAVRLFDPVTGGALS